jgi:hypothetical protein
MEGFDAIRCERQPFVFLDQRWRHHGAHSGYLIASGSGFSLPRDNRLLPYPISNCVARIKQDREWEQRLIIQLMLRAGNAKVLHLVDGDFDNWAYRSRASWLDTRITATFHQTDDKLPDIARCVKTGSLDGVVCVSRVQIPFRRPAVAGRRITPARFKNVGCGRENNQIESIRCEIAINRTASCSSGRRPGTRRGGNV